MKRNLFYALIIILALGCKEAFTPDIVNSENNTLVVDGFITGGTDSTYIKLSRVSKTSSKTFKAERGAVTVVEDDLGNTHNLTEITAGTYSTTPFPLTPSRKYRVRIKTTDGLVHLSTFEAVTNAPPIDTVIYNINADNVKINVSAHDAPGNSRYYRWEFAETWKFNAFYLSNYVFQNNNIVQRTSAQQVYQCFAFGNSPNVLLGTSIKLSQNVISQMELTTLSANSEKLGIRYSMLVKQYAITKEAYDFWANLQTSTENLGSIFDAQPSTAAGNVHCTTSPVVVIGFVGVGRVQQKRIFIDKKQLPAAWMPTNYDYDCKLDTLNIREAAERFPIDPNILITTPYLGSSGLISGYVITERRCADCTLRGTTNQPSYWK